MDNATRLALHNATAAVMLGFAERGASAKDLADYLEQAAKGMRVNAAFGLSGLALAENLRLETE